LRAFFAGSGSGRCGTPFLRRCFHASATRFPNCFTRATTTLGASSCQQLNHDRGDPIEILHGGGLVARDLVTILDLGSNAGFTVLYFARVYPQARIACIEPIADNLALLRENLAANHVSAEVFAAAVAVDEGRLTMTTDAHDYGHKVSGIAYGPQVAGQTVDVEALSIPTLMKRLGWDRIGLLKIDIEGYEGVLLKEKCDWLSGVDAMCIECHEGYGEKDLRALAETYGFQPPRLLPGTWLLVRNGL
jgi:FkbM family methyltransferase